MNFIVYTILCIALLHSKTALLCYYTKTLESFPIKNRCLNLGNCVLHSVVTKYEFDMKEINNIVTILNMFQWFVWPA